MVIDMDRDTYFKHIEQAYKIVLEKNPIYKDNWKRMPIEVLLWRINDKANRIVSEGVPLEKLISDMKDIINYCVFSLERLKEVR
jgi:hypothetical protein